MHAEGKTPKDNDCDRLRRAPRLGPAATHWPFSSHLPPFPVQAPYQAKPDLLKLSDALLHEDGQWHDWIREKEAQDSKGDLLHIDPRLPPQRLAELTRSIVAFFQTHSDNGPIDGCGDFAWLGGLRVQDPETVLRALSLSLQEDFVLMANLDGHGLCAVALSVCFPSGWNPKEKMGDSMRALHEPVADNERLQMAMPALSHAICTKGPFVRHVWTLTGDGARARAPAVDSTATLSHASQLWFRCERQITIPLGHASLFLIRVLTAPFDQVVNNHDRLTQLADALQSMSPEMLTYKQLHHARRLVLSRSDRFRATFGSGCG